MKSLLRRGIFLSVFGVIVAGITFRIAISSTVRHERTPRFVATMIQADPGNPRTSYQIHALLEDTGADPQVNIPAARCDDSSAPVEPAVGEANAASMTTERTNASFDDPTVKDADEPDPFAETVNEILRIRGRVAARGSGELPTDPASQREFAAMLREVIAREQQQPCAVEPETRDAEPGIAVRESSDAAELPPTFDLPPPPMPGASPRSLLPPFVATVHTRTEVVGALRQIGRQIDTLAADLEDQQQFDEAESLRILVQSVRAEARRLESRSASRSLESPPQSQLPPLYQYGAPPGVPHGTPYETPQGDPNGPTYGSGPATLIPK